MRTPTRIEWKDIRTVIKGRIKAGEKALLSFQGARKWSDMLKKKDNKKIKINVKKTLLKEALKA